MKLIENYKNRIISYLNNKDIYNFLVTFIPASVIFTLSYTVPTVLSIGLFWQIALPLLVSLACYQAGYEYFQECYYSLKASITNIYNYFKNKNKLTLPTLDMSFLISLSTVSSIIYVLFLGTAAPLSLFTAPLFTLAAINISKYFKNIIHDWQNKKIQTKLYKFKSTLPDQKNLITINENDILTIQPGSHLPVDSYLESDHAEINDCTVVTGEDNKCYKATKGSKLYAGTKFTGTQPILIRARCNGTDSIQYKRIQELSKEHQQSNTSKFIDDITAKFIPVVLILATSSLIIWGLLSGFTLGFGVMMDVIFAACPCALGLASNLPYSVLKKILFSNDISIFNNQVIENLNDADTIVFDKTGTLTKLTLDTINLDNNTLNQIELTNDDVKLAILRSEELRISVNNKARAGDPFATEIIGYLSGNTDFDKSINCKLLNNESNGITASIDEKYKLFIGDKSYLVKHGFNALSDSVNIGIEKDNKKYIVGNINFKQTLKDDAVDTIQKLKKSGFSMHMLTGDNNEAAKSIAKKLNIKYFKSNCSPSSKKDYILNLIKAGRKIIMVGDGFNDFECAKAANIASIAVGRDAVMSSFFDITVNKLRDILKLQPATKLALNNQKQLFLISIGYNITAMIVAAIVLPAAGMPLMLGCFGVCMALSSLFALAWSCLLIPGLNKIINPNKSDETDEPSKVITDYDIYKKSEKKQSPKKRDINNKLFNVSVTLGAQCEGCVGKIKSITNDILKPLIKFNDFTSARDSQNKTFTIDFECSYANKTELERFIYSTYKDNGKIIKECIITPKESYSDSDIEFTSFKPLRHRHCE